MKYLFRRGEEDLELSCSMRDIEVATKMLAVIGYRRVYTPPEFTMFLTRQEAYEESVEVAREEDAKAAKRSVEAHIELARAIEEESSEGELDVTF